MIKDQEICKWDEGYFVEREHIRDAIYARKVNRKGESRSFT
jgi:hypothetical protein